jgi:hypothetical protein
MIDRLLDATIFAAAMLTLAWMSGLAIVSVVDALNLP